MRIPALSAADGKRWADSGGMLFYGMDIVAAPADRNLKVANSADLPIE